MNTEPEEQDDPLSVAPSLPEADDPTDIDELMRRIDEEIEFGSGIVTPKYIDAVVAYQRQQRARRVAGVKTKRSEEDGPKLNINQLLNKPVFKMNRRV
jgi:hypothetical protein